MQPPLYGAISAGFVKLERWTDGRTPSNSEWPVKEESVIRTTADEEPGNSDLKTGFPVLYPLVMDVRIISIVSTLEAVVEPWSKLKMRFFSDCGD